MYYQPLITQGQHSLDEEESRHAIKVLRSAAGDIIHVTDGKGWLFECRITGVTKSSCEFEIISQQQRTRRNYQIHLYVAPTKNIDRMEWLVEKITELGVDTLGFISCANSERTVLKIDRLQKKAISAIKQSKQLWLPEIQPLVRFSNVLISDDQKFIAHKSDDASVQLLSIPLHGSYRILIGPEGDFSDKEIDQARANGFQLLHLGENVLRTETAALVACQSFHFIHQVREPKAGG